MIMPTSTRDELSALSPEYLAEENNTQPLIGTCIAFIVIPTVVYAMFLVSRIFCASRNGWEVWALYPLSYLLTIASCIIGIGELFFLL